MQKNIFDINSSKEEQQKAIELNIKNVAKVPSVASLNGGEFTKGNVDLIHKYLITSIDKDISRKIKSLDE